MTLGKALSFLGKFQTDDNLTNRRSERRQRDKKTRVMAFCNSVPCIKSAKGYTDKQISTMGDNFIHKPHAKFTAQSCIDCGSALFWKRK